MKQVMVLDDGIGQDWFHHLHVAAVAQDLLGEYEKRVPVGGRVERYEELRIYHLKAHWPIREVRMMQHLYHPKAFLPVAAWWIGEARVSELILEAVKVFQEETGREAVFAYMQELPAKAQSGMEVHGVVLNTAEWVAKGYLAITGGGWVGLPAFRK